ncbi:hypothetical protein GAYE_SCF23G4238 [Galdieria yellowstonensis]|uniref:Uncharacterized protein n=1 Tax=Galdieria yellowstonensis TaxID=3028027 RepID=A0AAV9IG71_9RHOD|nr:hypothetical protein GAYE_SCF23G4238 [Galdieria yellowstonensis]
MKGKEQSVNLRFLPTYLDSSFIPKVSVDFFSPTLLENLKEEDLESFALDDLLRFTRCKWSCFENNTAFERTLQILPPGESWNKNAWENIHTALKEVYPKELDGTTSRQVVGKESLSGFALERLDDSWTKVLKCKLCSRLISVESFGSHLMAAHPNAVESTSRAQVLDEWEERTFNDNSTSKLHRNGYASVSNPLSPFFHGDEERVAQLQRMDKERRRHLESRILQYPRVYKRRRRSLLNEEAATVASNKWKLQKDKKPSTTEPSVKEGSSHETDEWLSPLMVTSYVAAMHDWNKVDKTIFKEFPDHVDLSRDPTQNERGFENALEWLVKKRNIQGNISDCIERQKHMREAISSHKKEHKYNSFLTDSGSLFVSKVDAAASAAYRSKMNGVRVDNHKNNNNSSNSTDICTVRNGNFGWNNPIASYSRAPSSTAAPIVSRYSQENRMAPTMPTNNRVETKYSGAATAPTGKVQVDNQYLMMEGDNLKTMKSEMPGYSSQLPMAAAAAGSSHSTSFVTNQNIGRPMLSSDQLQPTNMQLASFGGSKATSSISLQNVHNAGMKANNSNNDSKGRKKSTKSGKRERTSFTGEQQPPKFVESQGEATFKSNSERMPYEKLDMKESNMHSMNTFRSNPQSSMIFPSRSPRILSNASASRSMSPSESMEQRSFRSGPTKHLNDLVDFMERKLENSRTEMSERSGTSMPSAYYTGHLEESETTSRDHNASFSQEYWKQSDRRNSSQGELESLSKEQHRLKYENRLSNNNFLSWKEPTVSTNEVPFHRGQLSNNSPWTTTLSPRLSNSPNNNNKRTYEDMEDVFDNYGDNDGGFTPRTTTFMMDRNNNWKYDYDNHQPKKFEQSLLPLQERSESSTTTDAIRSSRMETGSELPDSNYLSMMAGTSGWMPDSVASSYRTAAPMSEKAIRRNLEKSFSNQVPPSPVAGGAVRNGRQVPTRSVAFGSFGMNAVSATSLQTGWNRQNVQRKPEESYGFLQNLRGGSQSLSSLMTSEEPSVSSKKMSYSSDTKQLQRLHSPNVVSSPRLDSLHLSPSIDSRVTLSTGNLRRKEYRIRTNTHEGTYNFDSNNNS